MKKQVEKLEDDSGGQDLQPKTLLWVAEGLLKSVKSKSLENVAEEYLLDLVDRNHILACDHSSKGKIKTFRIHDVLRDLCVREAEREKFFCVTNSHLDGIRRHLSNQSHKMRDHHANKISTSVMSSNFGNYPEILSMLGFRPSDEGKIMASDLLCEQAPEGKQ
ncbi:putative late blight resistance protein-like protein R1B-16 [Forsythia ovata]|uniref:Late blight resistance protein-like protein R1B-16 n=1 Tax=Forsythia ovata TaxID=205694 RepID=A0ABD1TS53_9LAMI